MKRTIWEGAVCEIPCNEDGMCGFVEEYAEKYQHAFCYGYSGPCNKGTIFECGKRTKIETTKCPFYGLKQDTIVRMVVEE